MPGGPDDDAVAAPLRPGAVDGEDRLAAVAADASVVDLVALHPRGAECRGDASRPGQHLVALEDRLDRQEPEALHRPGAALHAVVEAPAEHLVATADAQDRFAGPGPLD